MTHCSFKGTCTAIAEAICMWRAELGTGAPGPGNWRVHVYNYMLPVIHTRLY